MSPMDFSRRRSSVGLRVLGTLFLLLALFFVIAPAARCQTCVTNSQVTLTGNLRSANGIPSSNYILTLAPSQQGFIAGCGVNLPLGFQCGTSVDGSVVGIPNPLTPTVNSTSGSGSLPSGVYYTVFEFYDAAGNVTLPSPETRTTLSATESLVVNPPSSGVPAAAVGMKVFIGTSSGGETLQGTTTGTASFVQSTPLVTGASPASTNTTLCKVTANDSVWPVGTGYNVSLVDSFGNPVPQYPMQWQLLGAGTTYDLSNGLPYYHGVVFYPVPILAQPANHGTQRISGSLDLGGYNLLNAGKVGIGTATPGWPLDVENGLGNFETGFLLGGVAPSGTKCAGSTDSIAIDAYLTCVTGTAYQVIQLNGTPLAAESIINLTGRLSGVDNPGNHSTDLSVLTSKVQLALPATTVGANTCSAPATASLAGTTSTATFSTAFATNPNAAVGWGASGGLVVELWPDASPNVIDWSICNQTTSAITPTAITLNVGLN